MRPGERDADLGGRLLHERHVDAAVLPGGSAHADEGELAVGDGGAQVGSGAQPDAEVAPEQLLQAPLEDGRLAPFERGHLALVDVDADNGVPLLGQPHRRHQADVARPDHRDAHQRSSPPRLPLYHSIVRRSPSRSVTRGW